MTTPLRALSAAALLLSGAAGCADTPSAPATEADGTRTLSRWPYRAFLAGLDAFDNGHRLAPGGVLRFTLPRKAASADDAGVALDGKAGHQVLPLDGIRFTLPRIDKFDRRDTRVIVAARDKRAARKGPEAAPSTQGAFENLGLLPLAEVRTPDLPDGVYRLGDLRLACKVSVAVVKDQTPWWLNALIAGVLRSTDWCDGANKTTLSTRAAHRFVAVTMRDGAREKRLSFDQPRDELPLPPLGQDWSDDTLLIVEPEPAP